MHTKRQLFDHETCFNNPLWESRKMMKTDSRSSVFDVNIQDKQISRPLLAKEGKSLTKYYSFLKDPYVNMLLNAKENLKSTTRLLNTRSNLLDIKQNSIQDCEADLETESFNEAPKNINKSTNGDSHFNFKAIRKIKQTSEVKTKEQFVNQYLLKSEDNKLESIRVFTGTIELVLKWNKIYKEFCHYEVFGPVVSLQEGSVHMEKILLLKNKKGPVLQIVYYSNDYISIENFYIGQMLKCVGRMIGPNMCRAVSIRDSNPEEVSILQRMCYINDHAISKAIIK